MGDEAPSNWSQFGLHFPKRVKVLDWYHTLEHLWAAGKDRWGEGSAPAQEWVEARKQELWEGRVEAVLAALGREEGETEGQRVATEGHYFETNRERMRYAEFRAQGYPIGSETVESACKGVIGVWLKQAGMCWTKADAQAVLSLRADLLSGRWDRFVPPPAQLKAD